MNKYRNIPTVVDNIRFDSKREAERYYELKLMEVAGNISNLRIHPVYTLIPPFKYNGRKVQGMNYEGDFEYLDNCDKVIVEDVKGFETAVFKIKQKLFWWHYPMHELRIVR
jgi:hypothetical protein